jgi:hypothetical protein
LFVFLAVATNEATGNRQGDSGTAVMKTSYDRTTDCRYLELRPLPAVRTVEVGKDVPDHRAADGKPGRPWSGLVNRYTVDKRQLVRRGVPG